MTFNFDNWQLVVRSLPDFYLDVLPEMSTLDIIGGCDTPPPHTPLVATAQHMRFRVSVDPWSVKTLWVRFGLISVTVPRSDQLESTRERIATRVPGWRR